jgi:primosomal protein N' (replication factor Y) (superfamily II helicase)
MPLLEFNTDTHPTERETLFAEVILPLHLPKSYTYRIPFELNGYVTTGKRVIVQFGKRKIYAGVVKSISTAPPKGYEAKYLLHVLDDVPIVNEKTLTFWDWMAAYYMSPIGDVMNAALPSALKLESESKIKWNEDVEDQHTIALSPKEQTLLFAIKNAKEKEISLGEVADILNIKNTFPVIRSLFDKGLIIINEEIKDRYKPKIRIQITLSPLYQNNSPELKPLFEALEKRAPRQLEVLLQYFSLSYEQDVIYKDELIQETPQRAALNSLVTKGVFIETEVVIDRLFNQTEATNQNHLNEEQQKALNQIETEFIDKEVVLLHGITGSGKTHVYIELIKQALAKGQQVLYLLPEIALTVQLVGRLRAHFGNSVVVSHSRFNENERVEIWKKVAEEKAQVIVGPRSAVFLPFQQLGLIIIDEEHEGSFKQFDPAPRYHGRDAAIYLAHLWKAKTLLGTATPSVETYYNAKAGKYGLVKLHNRFGTAQLPQIITADMADAAKKNLLKGPFTQYLLDKLTDALAHQQQTILFQNRKGFVPLTVCKSCGWVPKCENCDISLTYYKFQHAFKCQYCGYTHGPYKACEACGSHHLEMTGYGTERIEEELQLLLPNARTERFDLENTRTKNAYYRIIRDFESKDIDVLIGTQMVAKGLDFEDVQLVGILDADQLLHQPDFRANERAFYLMGQVAGRAGRREKQGLVIIQTRRPHHPTIQYVIDNDYETFYQTDLAERYRFNYPPYFRLINLRIKNKDADAAENAAQQMAHLLREKLGDRVLGPQAPYISRIKTLYIRNIMIKIERERVSVTWVKDTILQCIEAFMQTKENRKTIVQVDVDAYF